MLNINKGGGGEAPTPVLVAWLGVYSENCENDTYGVIFVTTSDLS